MIAKATTQYLLTLFIAFQCLVWQRPHASADEAVDCENLQNQFEYYRTLAKQDRKQLNNDLKKKENKKKHKQNAIRMQLREMDEAQKKSRELHSRLEKDCS